MAGSIGPLHPGDVIIANDPYSGGGTHLSDVAMIRPVFWAGTLIGFAAAKGHWTDVGGKDPGSWTADSTDVYAEGLQLPFVHAFRAGAGPGRARPPGGQQPAAGDDDRRPVRVQPPAWKSPSGGCTRCAPATDPPPWPGRWRRSWTAASDWRGSR